MISQINNVSNVNVSIKEGSFTKSSTNLKIFKNKDMGFIKNQKIISNKSVIKEKNKSDNICFKDIHKPFETENGSSLFVLIISIILVLVIRFFKKYFASNSLFSIRSLFSVLNYNFVYCICFSFVFVLYSYGALDVFNINIEKNFIGFVIFSFVWNVYLILLCISFNSYNEFLKSFDEKNYDFKSLKIEYERVVNSKYNLNKLDESFRSDTSNTISKSIDTILNYFSLLIMKYYFILPFEPKFKSYKLKKDFHFGNYISESLLLELKGFFSITWTSIVTFLTLLLIWTQIIEVKDYHVRNF